MKLLDFSLPTDNVLHTFYAHVNQIQYIDRMNSSNKLLSCGLDNTVKLWEFLQNRIPIALEDAFI